MNKPIIGIVGKTQSNLSKVKDDLWHRVIVADEIRYHIIKNGGIAISLLPTEETLEFNDNDTKDYKKLTKTEIDGLYIQIDLCDGIILQGGLTSNNYEVEIAKRAIETDKPLLGICAGFNNILRALGGDVILDKSNNHNHYDKNYRHDIIINENTQLYKIVKKRKLKVNSIHTMVATREMVGPYAKISSCSSDGLVESFELPNKRFVQAIKWHPELIDDEKYVDKLFGTFISKCDI